MMEHFLFFLCSGQKIWFWRHFNMLMCDVLRHFLRSFSLLDDLFWNILVHLPLIFIVLQQESCFPQFYCLFSLSTFAEYLQIAAVEDFYVDFVFCSTIIKWKHSISLSSLKYISQHVFENIQPSDRAMCVYLCLLFEPEKLSSYTASLQILSTGGDFCILMLFPLQVSHGKSNERKKEKEKSPRIVSLIINNS